MIGSVPCSNLRHAIRKGHDVPVRADRHVSPPERIAYRGLLVLEFRDLRSEARQLGIGSRRGMMRHQTAQALVRVDRPQVPSPVEGMNTCRHQGWCVPDIVQERCRNQKVSIRTARAGGTFGLVRHRLHVSPSPRHGVSEMDGRQFPRPGHHVHNADPRGTAQDTTVSTTSRIFSQGRSLPGALRGSCSGQYSSPISRCTPTLRSASMWEFHAGCRA